MEPNTQKPSPAVLLLALAAGAGLAYFADSRHRAKLREQASTAMRASEDAIQKIRQEWNAARGYADPTSNFDDLSLSPDGRDSVGDPLARWVAATVGSALIALGIAKRRGMVPAAIAGAGLLARAVRRR